MQRANLLVCLGLGLLACPEDRADLAPAQTVLPASAPGAAEFNAYARGTSAEIRLLRRMLGAGDSINWSAVDSVAAQAAGMSIRDFHAMSALVEASLRERAAIANEMQRLDSLRVELKVLRVRVEAQP